MTDTSFPVNIVDALAVRLATIDGINIVHKKPLEPIFENGSLGIFATNWSPDSREIGAADTMGTYHVYIQTLFKYSDREEGAAISSKCVKSLRVMVYRDSALRVALGGLSETILSVTERTVNWGIQEQRYQDNNLRGQFLFASSSHFWLATEISS